MSSFQLSDRVLYYWIPITCYTSSFKYNCSPSFHSVTEKSKQKFPMTHTYQWAKIHQRRMNVEEFMK